MKPQEKSGTSHSLTYFAQTERFPEVRGNAGTGEPGTDDAKSLTAIELSSSEIEICRLQPKFGLEFVILGSALLAAGGATQIAESSGQKTATSQSRLHLCLKILTE